jgi:cysteine synthase
MTVPVLLPDTLSLIGNTPLVRLKGPSDAAGCDIFGKCEFANPGASVKDRAALWIVRDAEEKGLLQPGGTIVEGTAGNTGIGLALVANALGYKTVIVMPETQSREKMDTLRALRAELVLVPAAPFSNPGHFVHTSRRIAEETEGAIWANQFDNIANRRAHIESTAPEIWEQMEHRIDGFTCAAGTGGTIAGTSLGLKAFDEDITIALTDPHGAALQLLRLRRAEGRRVVGGRRDRAGAHHRQPRRRADRYPVPHLGRGRPALGQPAAGRGRAVPWPVERDQRGRRGGAGAQAGGGRPAAAARGHDPVRYRLPLPVLALQPGMAEGEESAGISMAATIG